MPGTLRATSAREENFLLVLRFVWLGSELRALPLQFTPKHRAQRMLETIVAHGPRCGGKSHLSCSTPSPRPKTPYKSPACERRSPAQPPEKGPPPLLSRQHPANARFRERQDRIQPLPSTLLESRGAPRAAQLHLARVRAEGQEELPSSSGVRPVRDLLVGGQPQTAEEPVALRTAAQTMWPLRRFFGRSPAGYRPPWDELLELEVQTRNHDRIA